MRGLWRAGAAYKRTLRAVRRWGRRGWRDVRGDTAVLIGVAMPAIVGFFGLGVEVGHWYLGKIEMQSAADAASIAAAAEMREGGSREDVVAAALRAAYVSGFNPETGELTVVSPLTAGPHAGSAAVEVIATRDEPLLFASFFLSDDVVLQGRAVALASPGRPVCILALDSSASGAVTVQGTADVVLDGCEVAANSVASDAFSMVGSSRLRTDCLSTVGGARTTGGLALTACASPATEMPPLRDPYAEVPSPTSPSSCTATNAEYAGPPSATYTLSAGRYCGGLSIKRTASLDAGVYIIDGGLLEFTAGASVSGSGVTFFLTNGARLQIAGGAQVSLSAPTSGPYAGLVFYGDRNGATVDHFMGGDAASEVRGAIYFPSQSVTYAGTNSAARGCTQVVARTIVITGTSSFASGCAAQGNREIASASIRIVE